MAKFSVFPVFYLLLIFVLFVSAKDEAPYDYDVIIMGAGMTGISAGKVLNDAGMKILIIEAQDYVGGRTKVAKLGNYTFNVGGSWIEGICPTLDTDPAACAYNGHIPKKENPMVTLANKYNITSTDAGYFDYTFLEFIPQGSNEKAHFSNKSEVEAAFTKWNTTQDCMAKLMDTISHDISYFTALYTCGWQQPLSPIEKAVQYVGFTFEYSEEAKYTSFWGSEQTIFEAYGKWSNFITDPRGYAGITLGLGSEYLNLQNISDEPKLLINSPITKIEYNGESKVTVRIENGTTYNAKYGINTFSLGVFQSDIIEYEPPLDDEKRDAYLSYSMIDYLPVLVQWPYNFWDELGIKTHVIDFVDERDNFWIWAYNFDHPSFYPGSHTWRFDIIIGDAVRVQFQSNEATINELINDKLKYYFGEGIVPQPVNILHHDWTRNRYVQGMYSDWNVGMTQAKIQKMKSPYTDAGLYFAGEAVSKYSGDVNGAYDIGINVANQIIAANKEQ
eukprot:546080_1